MAKPIYIYVTPFFPSRTNWRGAYGYDFVAALMACGQFDVRVFVPGASPDYEIGGVKVHCFPVRELPSGLSPFFFRKYNEVSFVWKLRTLGIDVKNVGVCHGNTARFAIYPILLKVLNPRCKSVLHHHDLQSFGLNLGVLHRSFLYNTWLFRVFRGLFEQIDCHVFVSEAARRSFLRAPNADWCCYDDYKAQMRGPRFFRVRPVVPRSTLVLNNGVDTHLFDRHAVDAAGEGKECFVIGCVGNFEKLKDQETLIRAVGRVVREGRLHQPLKVVFVGSGPRLEPCKDLARDLGVNAEFRQEVVHEQLVNYYKEFDLFALPSYFEGFGCVYAEALACGIPVVGVKGQGVEDIVSGEWLIPPHDDIALAGVITDAAEGRMGTPTPLREIDIHRLVKQYVIDLSRVGDSL